MKSTTKRTKSTKTTKKAARRAAPTTALVARQGISEEEINVAARRALAKLLAEGWTIKEPPPPRRELTEEEHAARRQKEADARAAMASAVATYDAATTFTPFHESARTLRESDASLVRAVGVLGCLMAEKDQFYDKEIQEAVEAIIEARQGLYCIGAAFQDVGIKEAAE